MIKLSIIMPVYNEYQTVEKTLSEVMNAPLPTNWVKELIVVDDGSEDGSGKLLSKLQKNGGFILVTKKNGGKGSALKEGLSRVSGNFILIQDADLEYNPREYGLLLQPIINNEAGIVFGSRNQTNSKNKKSSWLYYSGGVFLNWVFNLIFGTNFTDIHTCYKVFPESLVNQLLKYKNDEFAFDAVDLTYTCVVSGLKIKEVPISYQGRKPGEGKKIKFRHGLACLKEMIKLKIKHG